VGHTHSKSPGPRAHKTTQTGHAHHISSRDVRSSNTQSARKGSTNTPTGRAKNQVRSKETYTVRCKYKIQIMIYTGMAKRNTQWDANTKFKSWSTQGWQTTGTSIGMVLVIIGYVHIHMQSHLLIPQLFNSSLWSIYLWAGHFQWYNWGFLSSGMWHYIAGRVVPTLQMTVVPSTHQETLIQWCSITSQKNHNPQIHFCCYFMYPGPTTTKYAYQDKDS
jgi:cation transport ATPase